MNININHRFLKRATFLLKQLKRILTPSVRHQAFYSTLNGDKKLIDSIYIINLDRQPGRWKQIFQETKREKISKDITLADYCHRVPAVDGKTLDMTTIPKERVDKEFNLKDQYAVDPDPRLLEIIRDQEIWITMTKEEIAVCLSHILCWKRIIDENRSFGLIMEDDIFFEGFFSKKLNRIWNELPVNHTGTPIFDLLYLSYREVDWGAEKESYSENLNKPLKGLWWLSGYVLSYQGAKKLLDLLPVKGPIDLWINLQFPKLDVYASVPSLIFQRNDLQSGNSYSILPILSQIGIQSDKTHLELQQRKGRNPVFVVTDNASQAAVVTTALSVLGYRCYWDQWEILSEKTQLLIDQNEPLLFDAYIALKGFHLRYNILESMYPNSVFIWMTEVNFNPVSDPRYIFETHFDNLPDGFYYDKHRHLAFNTITKPWESLCRFLDCRIPPFPFPILQQIPNYELIKNNNVRSSDKRVTYLEHDVTPWIIPIERLPAFGIEPLETGLPNRIGQFEPIVQDFFQNFNNGHWMLLEESFPSNLAEFSPDNFKIKQNGGFKLTLEKRSLKSRSFCSASIVSRSSYLYGKFEIVMKPVKMDGVITAFFLHRNDPWQELDIEFLGKDTTRVLLNVYFNPGSDGSGWNFGVRGTPVLIDLGFDAADDFHTYSIEWEPHEIRWLVDGNLVHARASWQPSPITNQPMKVFVNLWPPKSEELAGIFNDQSLPITAHILSISIDSWTHNAFAPVEDISVSL